MEFLRLFGVYIVCWILASELLVWGLEMNGNLQNRVFQDYNKYIRPSKKLGDVVKVDIFFTLIQLISVNEKSEEMTTSQYATLRWKDHRLKWDPDAYEGIRRIRVPSQIVWKPDLALANNIDGHYDKSAPVNAILTYTGEVEWLPPAIYKSSCSIQVEYFPFDWQNCTLRFRSFAYSTKELMLYSVYSKVVVDKEAYTDNGEWTVIHCPVKVNRDTRDEDYQDITLYFIIQRKPLFYIISIIVPCILISFLSVLVFYLPRECSEKTNMSISVLLGLPVYLLLLAKRVPETSLAIPLIGKYLLFTMLSETFSVVFCVVVLNLYHRTPTTHEMNPWVRRVFIEFLPPLLYMNTQSLKPSRTRESKNNVALTDSFEHKKIQDDLDRNDEKDGTKTLYCERNDAIDSFRGNQGKDEMYPEYRRDWRYNRQSTIHDEVNEHDVNGVAGNIANAVYHSSSPRQHPKHTDKPIRVKSAASDCNKFYECTSKVDSKTHYRNSEPLVKTSLELQDMSSEHQNHMEEDRTSKRRTEDSGHREYTTSVPVSPDAYFNITEEVVQQPQQSPSAPRAQSDAASSTDECAASNIPAKANETKPLVNVTYEFDAPSSQCTVTEDTRCRDELRKKNTKLNDTSSYVIHALPETANKFLQAINFIFQHMRWEDEQREKSLEWHIFAMVLDRLMLCVFLLVNTTGLLYFAIEALTNFPPDHPFHVGEYKYASCWEAHEHGNTHTSV